MKQRCDDDCLNCKLIECIYEKKPKLSKKQHSRNYYLKNRERIIIKNTIYNKLHEEKIKEYRKQYYLKNKEKLKKMIYANRDLKKKQGSK